MDRYGYLLSKYISKFFVIHLGILFCICIIVNFHIDTLRGDDYKILKEFETYLAILGIVLLVPIFEPEQSEKIRELVRSKPIALWKVYLGRLLISNVILFLTISFFVMKVKINNPEIDEKILFFITIAENLFLGSVGLLGSAISKKSLVGYAMAVVMLILRPMGIGIGPLIIGMFILTVILQIIAILIGIYTE